jgi:gluconolactonase
MKNKHPAVRSDVPFDVSRRTFVKVAAFGVSGFALTSAWSECAAVGQLTHPDPYRKLESDRFLGRFQVESRVEGEGVFLEGPAGAPDGMVYFTNVPASQILIWNPRLDEVNVYRSDSHMSNGLMFDARGRLLACEGETGRITRTDLETGTIEVLADSFGGNPLEAPNDVFVDATGRIYFSSRPGPAPAKGNVNAVYRLDPDGALHQLLQFQEPHRPNGIVSSPNGSSMYLIMAGGAEESERCIKAFDVDAAGDFSNERIFYDFYPGRSGDGMCVDERGNLYVAAGLHALRGTSETLDTRPGIHVISPLGELLAFRESPIDTVTNCTFGGSDLRTLYVTCGNLLLSLPTEIPGASFYRQRV